MHVQFGAKFETPYNVTKPIDLSDEVTHVWIKRIFEDPVVQLVAGQTSDDIVIRVEPKGPEDNRIVARIDRETLPEGVQRESEIAHFHYTYVGDPDRADKYAQWLNQHMLSLSNQLAAHDQRHRADHVSATKTGNGLDNVAGMAALKEYLDDEIIGPLKEPGLYKQVRANLPNGVLFFGPPGTGKTYLIDQLADELGIPVLKVSEEDVGSKYIHETVTNLGKKFDEAERQAPCILFLDELEALLPPRGELSGDKDYKQGEVSEMLQRMNNLGEKGVVVLATSNVPDRIDPAALRPGRLDDRVYIGPPDAEGRKASLEFHIRDRNIDDIDLDRIAEQTGGYTQADIKLLIDKAAKLAVKRARQEKAGKAVITQDDFEAAIRQIPPSVTPEIEKAYRSFASRGIGVEAHSVREPKKQIGFTLDRTA